jgi:hypothetical protein
MATYEKFLEYVAPAVSGATDPLMVRAVRDACIDFCAQSNFFVQTLDPIPSVSGIGDYDIETPDGTLVSKIIKVWYDSKVIEHIVQGDLLTPDSLLVTYGISTTPGTPRRVFFVANSSAGNPVLMFDPIPDTSSLNIVIVASLKPARDSTSVFDQLYEDYAEVIGHGAVGKIMKIKGAVFYDMVQAAIEDKAFRVGINDAMTRANFGNIGSKKLRVRPVRI